MENRFEHDDAIKHGKGFTDDELLSGERILELESALAQMKNIQLVQECAAKLGLRLSNFKTNNALELYFDVHHEGEDLVCVSKGWEDPGFRIMDIVKVPKDTPELKEKVYQIIKVCSKNLISIAIDDPKDEMIILTFTIGVYQGGLNAKVLSEAIKNLVDTVRAIRDII